MIFGDEIQIDDIHGEQVEHGDAGQPSDQDPNQLEGKEAEENQTKSIPEQDELLQEPDQQRQQQEILEDECQQQLSSKTAKATEIILGKIPEVTQLDKLRNNLARNPKSRYCINRYENYLAKIQVLVLKAVKELNSKLKEWDASFVTQHERLPNLNDYTASKEASDILHRRKVALKLLQSWKITVHL